MYQGRQLELSSTASKLVGSGLDVMLSGPAYVEELDHPGEKVGFVLSRDLGLLVTISIVCIASK